MYECLCICIYMFVCVCVCMYVGVESRPFEFPGTHGFQNEQVTYNFKKMKDG